MIAGQQRDASSRVVCEKRRERAPRRGDGLVDVGGRAERDLVHGLLGRGIDDGSVFLADGIRPRRRRCRTCDAEP